MTRPGGAARCWLASACTVAVLLLALLAVADITFETNDDCVIASVAGGYLTGTPDPATVYTSYLYGMLLSGLSRLLPAVPWHGALLLCLNLLSLTVILSCLLEWCGEHRLPRLFGYLGFLGLFAGVYLMFVAQLQFTAVSGMAFTAALLLALTLPAGAAGRRVALCFCAAGALVLLSFLLRPKVALMLSPFLALYALCGWVKAGSLKTPAVFFACGALALCVALWAADGQLYAAQPGWEAYSAYDQQATAFLDYNAYSLTQEQRTQALQAAGWPEELFDMARNWFFLDQRIQTEPLRSLNTALKVAAPAQSLPRQALNALYAAASVLRRYPSFGWNFAAYALAACCFLALALRRRQWAVALWLVGSMGYGLLLVLYFYGVLGRFPLRLALPVAALLYTGMLPCFGALLSQIEKPLPRRRALAAVLALLLCGNAASFALHGGEGVALRSQFSISRYNDGITREAAQVARQHPELTYVTNLSLDFLPFSVFSQGAFSNLVSWSSGITGSPAAMRQLAGLGYQSFDARQFYDPGVRLMLTRSPGVLESLKAYLENGYGATTLLLVEQHEGFDIYRAMKDKGDGGP